MDKELVVKTKEIDELGINAALLIGVLRAYCNNYEFTRATPRDIVKWSKLTKERQEEGFKVLCEKEMVEIKMTGLLKRRYVRLLHREVIK